jgi:hypothetical protein
VAWEKVSRIRELRSTPPALALLQELSPTRQTWVVGEPPLLQQRLRVMRQANSDPASTKIHLIITGFGLDGFRLPPNLGSGQRKVPPTTYIGTGCGQLIPSLSAHHSSVLTRSIPLGEVAPPFHLTHRSNGDYALAISPNLAKWQEQPRLRRQRNILV